MIINKNPSTPGNAECFFSHPVKSPYGPWSWLQAKFQSRSHFLVLIILVGLSGLIFSSQVQAQTVDTTGQTMDSTQPGGAPARVPAAQQPPATQAQYQPPGQSNPDSPVAFLPRIIQYNKSDIHSDFVLAPRRASFKKYLMEKTIQETFSGPLNQYTDYKFENACLSATQFLIKNQYTQRGFEKMFEQYFRLDNSARLALLTAVYGIYPLTFIDKVKAILPYERDPKLFAIAALYDYRTDSSIANRNQLTRQMEKQFANSSQIPLLKQLQTYLLRQLADRQTPTPSITELFRYQQLWKQKTVYSFQRWDRNYSGLSIVQYEDGHFAREPNGELKIFRQLARSGSGLPYFITNGNTPQGVYRIAGARVSIDKLIGPTPTLQSILPYQSDSVFFRGLPYDSTGTKLDNYKILLPPSWQAYPPMKESFWAGSVGRRYIVIHGSTLDGSFFEGWSFYPNSPTDGCLSTLESWDGATGGIVHSDQLDLVNTFLKTPGGLGILEVINLDNQKKNVTTEEINDLVNQYEKGR